MTYEGPERRRDTPIIPRPPRSTNMVDFVVVVFVCTVSVVIVGSFIAVFILSFVNEDVDYSSTINTLADITTTIIGALIGFIAGKGQGRLDEREAAKPPPPEPPP